MALTIAPPEPPATDYGQRHFDMGALWRLIAWGGAAAIALSAVAIISQTQMGAARIRSAVAHATEPVLAIAQVPRQTVERVIVDSAETRRLASEVRSLAEDRDRLVARIARLEHGIHDTTSSIQR
jgi:ubiquinone biosynthesis protein UbiJ